MNNTKTPNGASNGEKLTPEEEKQLLASGGISTADVIVVGQGELPKDVVPLDVTITGVCPAPQKGDPGYLTNEDPGSPIVVYEAAQMRNKKHCCCSERRTTNGSA